MIRRHHQTLIHTHTTPSQSFKVPLLSTIVLGKYLTMCKPNISHSMYSIIWQCLDSPVGQRMRDGNEMRQRSHVLRGWMPAERNCRERFMWTRTTIFCLFGSEKLLDSDSRKGSPGICYIFLNIEDYLCFCCSVWVLASWISIQKSSWKTNLNSSARTCGICTNDKTSIVPLL